MQYPWTKTVFPIALIFSFRMLGLFMLIPVFTVYAPQLQGATSLLIGIALGAYGLTQGLLQIPFGIWSDFYGRKPVLMVGLILFGLGSLIGIFSTSIYSMIFARIVQGTGAIGSVLIALLADLTPENQRTKGMAAIGMTIGCSFILAMFISPPLTAAYHLSSIFYLTVFLALIGILLLYKVIPEPPISPFVSNQSWKERLVAVFSNGHLLRLNFSIFFQHALMTATFFIVPMILHKQQAAGNLVQTWYFYGCLLLLSFIGMLPFLFWGEKRKQMKSLIIFSVVVILLTQMLLGFFNENWMCFCILLLLYFIAFNILEASLPALVSKQTMPSSKGAAMGVYSSFQFLGIFAGGLFAGFLYQWGLMGVFLGNAGLAFLWLVTTGFIKTKAMLSILKIPSSQFEYILMEKLKSITGVYDVTSVKHEGLIYLLVNHQVYQMGSAEEIINQI